MPFGFLSLLGPEILLLSLPVLLANVLSSYPAQYYGDFHYSAPLVPYFAVAAAIGAARLLAISRRARRVYRLAPIALAVWLLAWAGISYTAAGRGPLGGAYDPTPVAAHHRLLERFINQIPADAAVTATAAVHPHVSHRRFVYQFPWGLQPSSAKPAEWALLDVTTATDMAPGEVRDTVEKMLAGAWGVVDAADGYLLLRKGEPQKTIPPAFYDFTRSRSPGPLASEPLRFRGLEVADWRRWRETTVVSRWEVGQSFTPGTLRPWLEVTTPDGEPLYTFDDAAPPALIWYPPDRWSPGDVVAIESLPLFLPRFWGATVAAVHGPDPTEANDRLPANIVVGGDVLAQTETQALAGVYQRDENGRMVAVSPDLVRTPFTGESLSPQLGQSLREASAVFRTPAGDDLNLRAWFADRAYWPGATLDVWLRWDGDLPAGYTPFLHLRQGDVRRAGNDGPPRLFLSGLRTDAGAVNDWRQIVVPEDAHGEGWTLVVGVYNQVDGSRLPLLDASGQISGDELVLGPVRMGPPPVPDQACALTPETCAAQPLPSARPQGVN